jgi:ATP-dependent helicase HrpB
MGRENLPIDPLLPEIVGAVRERRALVLEAEPGAGKTTRVPAALLDAGEPGEIWVLEPRRLAARLAAERVARERGEPQGQTVGYQVRFEARAGPRTRLRFVTEGILVRRLEAAPSLDGISCVVLDEFHERHLEGDLALALLERLRRTERPDLAIVVLSATLETAPVAEFLGAPVIRAPGRVFPVAIEHAPVPVPEARLADEVAGSLERLCAEGLDGDVLVFLPGAAEIRDALHASGEVARRHDLAVLPLHGRLSPEEQDRALRPSARRKIILATNVAESSITIEGVAAVLDSGLARTAGHSSWSGLPTLVVEPVSRASAKQRAYRAGRTRPGRCLRLFTERDHDARPPFATPEIARADLAQLVLTLSAAGLGSHDLAWLEPPPGAAVEAGERLLERLGARDEKGKATPLGRRLLRFPLHPRLARVLVEAEERGVPADGAAACALLGERDVRIFQGVGPGRRAGPRRGKDTDAPSDVVVALERLAAARASGFDRVALDALGLDPGATRTVESVRGQLARLATPAKGELAPAERERALLRSLLTGYPDRVAWQRRSGELLLADGRSARLARESEVRESRFLVAVEAQELAGGEALVKVASAIEPDWLLDAFPEHVREATDTTWDGRAERVLVASKLVYGAIVLDESAQARGDPDEVARILRHHALARGPEGFADPDALASLAARTAFAGSLDATVPELDSAAARETLAELSTGRRSFAELRDADLLAALRARLSQEARRALERLAPEAVVLASGRRLAVHYERGRPPWVESRLQDFFGSKKGPAIGGGRVPLVLHLLAPSQRPVQVTQDLAGFWERHYPAIRRELSRKYPKHPWPEDPLAASPPPPGGRRR